MTTYLMQIKLLLRLAS